MLTMAPFCPPGVAPDARPKRRVDGQDEDGFTPLMVSSTPRFLVTLGPKDDL